MTSRTLIWSAKCLALGLAGIFVCGQITTFLTPPLWWVLHRTNETYLNRSLFQFRYFFALRALYGLLLGLVPISLFVEVLRSMNARFRPNVHASLRPELDWHRPILWAWTPLAFFFLLRFLMWQAPDQSVLSARNSFERFDYFFNPMALANLDPLAFQAPGLVFDIVIVTGPMVFLLAYTLGVWLRHQRPVFAHSVQPAPGVSEEQPFDAH